MLAHKYSKSLTDVITVTGSFPVLYLKFHFCKINYYYE